MAAQEKNSLEPFNTFFGNEVNDLESLTTIHLPLGRYEVLKDLHVRVNDKYASNRRRWIQVITIAHHFWNSWLSEYLLQLTYRWKWQANRPSISVGDLGFVKEDSLSRNK